MVSIPYLFHEIILVPYDSSGILLFFFLIPAAFLLSMWGNSKLSWRQEISLLILLPIILAVFLGEVGQWVTLSVITWFAFLSTKLLFNRTSSGRPWHGLIAILELLIVLSVYFQLLNYSRSQPDISELSIRLLLFLLFVAFFFHAAILYSALAVSASQASIKLVSRKPVVWIKWVITLPFIFFLINIIPIDTVEHKNFINDLLEDPPPNGSRGIPKLAQNQNADNRQNGLPLGDREEKYPSELQGQSGEDEKSPTEENEQGQLTPDDFREGQRQDNSTEESPRQIPRIPADDQGSAEKNEPKLEGMPSEYWDQLQQDNKNDQEKSQLPEKQYAVMIVQARVNPLYLAEGYLGDLSENGFIRSTQVREPLNELAKLHLIDIWEDVISDIDEKRKITEFSILTTLSDRHVAYRPFRIEPPILNELYYPFSLSYKAESRISSSTPEDWGKESVLSVEQREELDTYLFIPPTLTTQLRQQMRAILAKTADRLYSSSSPTNNPKLFLQQLPIHKKIEIILESFHDFQYSLGYTDVISLQQITEFLLKQKKGRCTDFAASAALFARILDLPARVVVGYIASHDLQTRTHKSALVHLQKKIDLIADLPLNELFLVTSVHKHAWFQVYLPRYGWVDLESTVFSKPPKVGENPNELDLVIPLIDEEGLVLANQQYQFPFRLFFTFLLWIIGLTMFALYAYRYSYQCYLYLKGRSTHSDNFHYRYRLFLYQLAHDGYSLKRAYQTPLQYAFLITHPAKDTEIIQQSVNVERQEKDDQLLIKIASLYTKLSLQMNWHENDRRETAISEFFRLLKKAHRRYRRKGFWAGLLRLLRLQGLALSKS